MSKFHKKHFFRHWWRVIAIEIKKERKKLQAMQGLVKSTTFGASRARSAPKRRRRSRKKFNREIGKESFEMD